MIIFRILKWLILGVIGVVALVIAVFMGSFLASNNQDVEAFTFAPAAARNQAADDGILIFGATRNTGLDVAEILAKRGDKVTAVVRSISDTASLQKLGVTLVPGDAMNMASLRAAMAGKNYRAVLTTIACFSCNPKPDYLGNKNIFDAAKEAGLKRMLLVTTVGSGDSASAAPLPARIFLRDMIPLKTQAEEALKAAGLDYTIIRPGGLKTASPTGRAILSEDRATSGIITRADLAQLIVSAIDDDRTIGKTFAAIDRDFKFPFDMR
ncbi:MAG: SDR family oxidoreductase [Alphaproteobacteria bacterium]|nr:SDR family oxidoreductase [Alphaproteobacteria bacterium]